MAEFTLTGPRGDNPLGYLTALGALVTLHDAGYRALLGWQVLKPRLLASCESTEPAARITDREHLVQVLHEVLHRSPVAGGSELQRAKKAMEEARRALKRKADEIKSRRLRRDAATEARRSELGPLQQDLDRTSRLFRESLAASAPDPTVTLGNNLTVPNSELIAHAKTASKQTPAGNRRWADLAAAYGVGDPTRPADRMLASPWALVSGSGHQDFLGSVLGLMVECTPDHLTRALFGPWEPRDEKYSLRLDTREDRRYALVDRDPSANKPLTLWGANRLAFEALRYFPCLPARAGMAVQGWRSDNGNWLDNCLVRWPLWDEPIGVDVVWSLLGLRDIWLDGDSEARVRLRGLGIRAVMQSRRIAVGQGQNKKYNLTPATPVWVDTTMGLADVSSPN